MCQGKEHLAQDARHVDAEDDEIHARPDLFVPLHGFRRSARASVLHL